MPIANLLNVSRMGLFAAQGTLQTISHNVSNVNTPGYSRQTAELHNAPGDLGFSGGGGVEIARITRQFDKLVDRREELGVGELGRLDSRARFLNLIEETFNEMDEDGLTKRLEGIYASADDLADNPTNPVGREELVAKADALARFVQDMHASLGELSMPVDQEVNVQIADINNRLKSLQEINNTIVRNDNTNPALDLKDQRRQMVLELGNLIDIQTLELPGDGLQIMTSKGQELLADSVYSATLSRSSKLTETGFLGLKIDDREMDQEKIQGGELRGLLEIRDEVINGPKGFLTRLEDLVDEMRFQFNQVHSTSVSQKMYTSQEGMFSLGRDPSGDFRHLETSMNALNTDPKSQGGQVISGEIQFSVGTDRDNLDTLSGKIKITKGMNLNQVKSAIDASGVVKAEIDSNNQLRILPSDENQIYRVHSDPSGVLSALNGYIGSPVDLSRVVPGEIVFAAGSDGDNLTLSTPISITKDMSIRDVVDGINNSGGVVSASIKNERLVIKPSDTSNENAVFGVVSDSSGILAALGVGVMFGGNGAQDLRVNPDLMEDSRLVGIGRLVVNDPVTPTQVSFDDGNNRGALALGDMRAEKYDINGHRASLVGHYAATVGILGSVIGQNQDSLRSQEAAQSFIADVRESISGVSLEEELTDLVRFQRAFQASSKMVNVADELMQTIISMV